MNGTAATTQENVKEEKEIEESSNVKIMKGRKKKKNRAVNTDDLSLRHPTRKRLITNKCKEGFQTSKAGGEEEEGVLIEI